MEFDSLSTDPLSSFAIATSSIELDAAVERLYCASSLVTEAMEMILSQLVTQVHLLSWQALVHLVDDRAC